MYVLHAHWQPPSKATESGAVLLWAETYPPTGVKKRSSRDHPSCADVAALRDLLGRPEARAETFALRLPGYTTKGPLPSSQRRPEGTKRRKPKLLTWNITGLRLAPVERAPKSTTPEELRLNTDEAFRFLRDSAPLAVSKEALELALGEVSEEG